MKSNHTRLPPMTILVWIFLWTKNLGYLTLVRWQTYHFILEFFHCMQVYCDCCIYTRPKHPPRCSANLSCPRVLGQVYSDHWQLYFPPTPANLHSQPPTTNSVVKGMKASIIFHRLNSSHFKSFASFRKNSYTSKFKPSDGHMISWPPSKR